MSTVVDNRQVNLELNSGSFEENARDTIDTLENLDKSLNTFTKKNNGLNILSKFADSFNLKGVETQIDSLKSKFAEMWDTASLRFFTRTIENITDDLYARTKNTFKSFTTGQLEAGFGRYEESVESVQRIMNATGKSIGEVTEQMDKLHWFTDETSFDFMSMSNNIASFTANGVDLGTATTAMIGIADAAGYYGVNTTKATHAMEGFAKALGKGFMDRQSFQWLRTAGLNTKGLKEEFMETAKEMGKLKKVSDGVYATLKGTTVSVEDFETAMSQGWLSSDVILKTLAKYGGATEEIYKKYKEYLDADDYRETRDVIDEMAGSLSKLGVEAFKAGQKTKTWSDAAGYVKTAVASGWQQTWEQIFGNYEEATEFWSNLVEVMYEVFVAGGQVRNEILKIWHDAGGRNALLESLDNIMRAFHNITAPIKAAWEAIFPPKSVGERANILIGITEKFRQITESIANYFEPIGRRIEDSMRWFEPFEQIFTGFSEGADDAAESANDLSYSVEELARQVIRGDWGNGEERIRRLREAGYCFELIQNKVNELLGCLFRYKGFEEEVSDTQEKATQTIEEQNEMWLNNIDGTEEAAKRVYNLMRIYRGVFSGVKMIADVLNEVKRRITEIAREFFNNKFLPAFDKTLEQLGDDADKFTHFVEDFFENGGARQAIDNFLSYLENDFAPGVKDFIDDLIPKVQRKIDKTKKTLIDFGKKALELGKKSIPWIGKSFGTLVAVAGKVASKLYELGQKAIPYIKLALDALWGVIQRVWKKIQDVYAYLKDSGAWDRLVSVLSQVKDIVLEIAKTKFNEFIDFLNNLMTQSSDANTSIEANIGGIFEIISDFVQNMIDGQGPVNDFFAIFSGEGADKASGIFKVFDDIVTSLTNVIDTLGGALKWLVGKVDSLEKLISKPLESISGLISTAADSVGIFVQNVAGIDIGETLKKSGLGLFLMGFGKLLYNFANGIVGIPAQVPALLNTCREAIAAYQRSLDAKALVQLSKAIVKIAGSIFVLSLIDPGRLNNVLTGLTILLMAMSLLASIFLGFKQMFMKEKEINTAAESAKKTTEAIKSAANGIAETFKTVLSDFGKSLAAGINKAMKIAAWGVAALGIAGGIFIIVIALKKIADMLNDPKIGPDKMKEAAKVILGILAVLSAVLVLATLFNGSKVAKEGSSSLFGLGAAFVGVSLGIFVLLEVLKKLTEYIADASFDERKMNSLWTAILAIGLLAVAIGIAAGLAGSNHKAIRSFSGLLIVLSGFILILMVPVALLAMLPVDEFEKAKNAMFAIFVFTTALTWMMGILVGLLGEVENPETAVTMINTTMKSLYKLAGVMIIFGVTAVLLGKYMDLAFPGFLAMGAILGVLVGLGIIAGKFAPSIDSFVAAFDKFGTAALKFSAAAALFGVALMTVSTGLVVAGYMVMNHGKELAVGIGVVLAAVCAVIIAKKFHLAKAIKTFIEAGGTGFMDAIPFLKGATWKTYLEIAAFLASIMPVAVEVLFRLVLLLVDNLATFISRNAQPIALTLGKAVMAVLKALVAVIGTLIGLIPGIGDGIIEHLFGENSSIMKGFDNAIAKLDSYNTEIKSYSEEGGRGIFQGFGDGMSDGLAGLLNGGFDFLGGLIPSPGQGRQKGEALAEETIAGFLSKYSEYTSGSFLKDLEAQNWGNILKAGIMQGLSLDEIVTLAGQYGAAVPDNIEEMYYSKLDELTAAAEAVKEGAIKPIKEIPDELANIDFFGKQPTQYTGDFAADIGATSPVSNFFNNNIEQARQAGAEWVNEVYNSAEKTAAENTQAAENVGGSFFTNLQNTFGNQDLSGVVPDVAGFIGENMTGEEGLATIANGGEEMLNTLQTTLTGGEIDIQQFGAAVPEQYGGGMSNNMHPLIQSVGSVKEYVLQTTEAPDTYNTGYNIVQGLINGMNDRLGDLQAVCNSVASTALTAINAGAGVESPSKYTTQTGGYIMQGLINGLRNKFSSLRKTSHEIGSETVAMLSDAVKNIQNYVNDNLNTDPVIRPVLDTSALQSGIMSSNGLWGSLGAYGALGARSVGAIHRDRSSEEMMDAMLRSALGDVTASIENNAGDPSATIEVPVNIDGREVARATAPYTRSEIARIDRNAARKGGKL